MKKTLLFLTITIIFLTTTSYAENFALDAHSGYGILRFEEKEHSSGSEFDSEFKHNVILFGLSGEYSFLKNEYLYAGANADWAFGLKDRETWKQSGADVQTNDMKVSMQFYDLRFGYKGNVEDFSYRFYVSGGWDGLRFKRDNYIWMGSPITKISIEEISLYKAGGGAGLGFKRDKWSLDGNIGYSYYPDGETEDSSLPQLTFDTKGTRLNIDLGVNHEITKKVSIYLGGNYTLQKLKGDTTSQDISWKTEMEILSGMINLMYKF